LPKVKSLAMREIKGFAKRERFNNESKRFCKEGEVTS
jgi:hypothetical protein